MLKEKFKELADYIFNVQVPEYYNIYIAYNNGLEFNFVIESEKLYKFRDWCMSSDEEEYMINYELKLDRNNTTIAYNDEILRIERDKIAELKAIPIEKQVTDTISSRYILSSPAFFNGLYLNKFAVKGGVLIFAVLSLYTLFISGNIDFSFASDITIMFFHKVINVLSFVFFVGIIMEITFGLINKVNNLNKRQIIKRYLKNKKEKQIKSKVYSLAIALTWFIITIL